MNLRLLLITIMTLLATTSIARSQTIESLVMPGDLVEAHADVEQECKSCHVRFNRAGQNNLCTACHEDVGLDRQNKQGFHGLDPEASSADCASCHTDHEGRDANIVIFNTATFDHEMTDYPLVGGHAEVACDGCHAADTKYRDAPTNCLACHREDDPHGGFMGEQCADCHTPVDWLEVEFDHDTTGYPLIGGHRDIECSACHADETFQGAPTTCFGCHQEDDAHDGRSGPECENCHNPTSWNDSSFDHDRDTDFALHGAHGQLACADCHSEDPFSDKLDKTCISCHLEDDHHEGHFGEECESCHNDVDWAESEFDHEEDTGYVLAGAHADIECEACHVEPVFDVELGDGCNDCHADEDPHKGEQGTECQECHNETDWEEDVFFDHDLTRFPLLGKHAEAECDDCHETQVFRDAPEACVDCHREDDPHEDRYTPECDDCHTPIDWAFWQFDHDALTKFPLTGAHATVTCEACHRQALDTMLRLGNRCGDCHRADDVHDGEFGSDCGRCHSADNFRDVRALQ